MIGTLAWAVVVAAAFFFILLGIASLAVPDKAGRFLLGFASSAQKHYAELGIRFLVGGALVVHGPQAALPEVFRWFGWLLIATTAVLLLVPWRWHHGFAAWAVPQALRFLPLIGCCSLVLGGVLLVAAWG